MHGWIKNKRASFKIEKILKQNLRSRPLPPRPIILSRVLSNKKNKNEKKSSLFQRYYNKKIPTQHLFYQYIALTGFTDIYIINASRPAPKNTKSKWLQKTVLSPKIPQKYICLFIEFPLNGKSQSIFEFYMRLVDEKTSKALKLVCCQEKILA